MPLTTFILVILGTSLPVLLVVLVAEQPVAEFQAKVVATWATGMKPLDQGATLRIKFRLGRNGWVASSGCAL